MKTIQTDLYAVSPLRDDLGFGVQVIGLDTADLADAAVRRSLHDLWIREGLIVFRGIEGDAAHLALSRCFGELMPHPVPENRGLQNPDLVPLHFKPADGLLHDVDGEVRGMYLPWHCDMIYLEKINRGGILRPVKVPSRLGQTAFLDKIGAYERLPDALKARIEGLSVVYQYELDPVNQRFGTVNAVRIIRVSERIRQLQANSGRYPRVIHPMAYRQPETGRTVLNVSPWFAQGIEGMETPEGDALLAEVAAYCSDMRHAYVHQWKLDDMVLWDNWRMLHHSPGAPADEERWMYRTSIEGDYGLGRAEGGGGEDAQYLHV